MTNSRDMEHVV